MGTCLAKNESTEESSGKLLYQHLYHYVTLLQYDPEKTGDLFWSWLFVLLHWFYCKCFLRDYKKSVVWKLKNSGSTNTVQITH